MQTVLEKKVTLIDTLSADASWILQYVQQEKLITKREYGNLNHDNHTKEKIVTNLIDNVMNKGEETCRKFVALLQREEVTNSFPHLKGLFIPAPTSRNQDNQVRLADEITEYKMSSIPRGLCVIINNVNFTSLKERFGSQLDAESLKEVFQGLGFTLYEHKNQTTNQMKELLHNYSQKQHDGDCFVCCILSHGSIDGVYGTDGSTISVDDIIGPFSGRSCPSLISKPKVFFIQACRGKDYQLPVAVQSDSYKEEEAEAEMEVDTLEMDAVQITLPAKSDFLVARSTIKDYVSFREPISGSWFIQSLCKQLKTHCPKGEDVLTILQCVNKEVSGKADRIRGVMKQMPEFKVTLRKKLVFRVSHQ